jgi:hypothetical protein
MMAEIVVSSIAAASRENSFHLSHIQMYISVSLSRLALGWLGGNHIPVDRTKVTSGLNWPEGIFC